MVEDASDVAAALSATVEAVSQLVDHVVARMRNGGRLIYVGAGTSGRLAQLDAAECIPTFGIDEGVVLAVLAGTASAAARAEEGAEDDLNAAIQRLTDLQIRPEDAVVGVSASGTTPFVLEAVRFASTNHAFTAGITNNPRTELASLVDVVVEAVVGPEVLAGSTRLKAGTAQKVILNTLSTVVMMKLGRTYNGYMVGVRSTNKKLIERSKGITAELTGLEADTAQRLLTESDFDVRTAVVSHLLSIGPAEARTRLQTTPDTLQTVIDRARKAKT